MKKVLIVSVLLAIACSAMAQMPAFRTGKFNKSMNYIESGEARVVSYEGNEVVMATNSTISVLGMKAANSIQALVTDTNLNVLRQVNISGTGYLDDVVYANKVDGSLYILIRNRVFHNYRRVEVDLKSMTVIKVEDIIINHATDSKRPIVAVNNSDRIGDKNTAQVSWYAKSDNNDYYGIVSIRINTVTNETAQQQFLLDNKFQPLWTKQYDVRTIDDLTVDNNGVMYTLGTIYNTDKQKTLVCMSQLDVDNEQTIEQEYAEGMIAHLKIVNVQNGRVVAAGPAIHEITPNKRTFDKLLAVSINTRDRSMKTATYDLSIEDMCVFNNSDFIPTRKAVYPEFIQMTHSVSTDNGGLALFQKSWDIFHYGGSSPDYHERCICGTVMMSIDSLGNIGWTKNFRSNYFEKTSFGEDPTYVSDLMLMHVGGNIYFMQQEINGAKTVYPDTKFLNKLFNFSMHNLGVYCIAPDGQVTKTLVKGGEAGSITGPFFRISGNRYFTLFASRKKSAPVYVNF